ncbi:MAG: DUF1254 domain-containing protein [Acetobacteraceae bacterium]
MLGLALPTGTATAETMTPQAAQTIGIDAYVYGYSLMTSEITRQAFTNVVAPSVRTLQAPMGQIVSQPMYPPANYKGVTAPNADTLYSAGFVDVSKQPWIFSYPDMHGRYFLFPIYSLWTEVLASPGKRTLGTGAQTIAITGPGWSGKLPKGVTQVIKSPTGIIFMIGRVYADGSAKDYAAVHALQRQFRLYPLSAWGKPYKPPPGTVDPDAPSPKEIVRNLISALDTRTYFAMLAKVMGNNPPVLPADAPMVASMTKIGLVPGQAFDLSRLDPAVQAALKDVGKLAYPQIEAEQTKLGRFVNRWSISDQGGIYGTNYLLRAAIAAFGWGSNQPKDAVYPFTRVGADGKPLSGANKYVLHFAKGETPPVDGFWSITMYDTDFYFYPNSLNKLTVSPRNHLKYNADGSLDLYFQHDSPGQAHEANWLPAPSGDFILMMRLYWPKETPPSILDGSWTPPPVRQVA